jgi:hypothetical protein
MLHLDNGDDLSNMLDAVAQAYSDSPTADSGSVVEEVLPELDTGLPKPDTDFPDNDSYEAFDEPPPTDPTTTVGLQCRYLKSLPTVNLPMIGRSIPILYRVTQEECMTSLSTEKLFSGIWKYWNKYCLEEERPIVYNQYSLGVYQHKEEDFLAHSNPPAKEYHCDTVHGFYKFLLSEDVVIGTSTMKCVSSFLNAHIKVEFLACLKQAGSQNVCIPNMTVGADPVIQWLVRFANKRQAETIRDMQLHIQSGTDSRISEEESQSMLLMAAGISMPNCGKVITKDRLSRLVFACTYTVSTATMRRGEDCYNQKLFQRFDHTMKTIGPAGIIVHFLSATKPT